MLEMKKWLDFLLCLSGVLFTIQLFVFSFNLFIKDSSKSQQPVTDSRLETWNDTNKIVTCQASSATSTIHPCTFYNNTLDLEDAESARLNYLNPYIGDIRYKGKRVCRTEFTWKDVAYPWSVLSERLTPNCQLIYGNLIIAGMQNEDDLSVLEHIEDISGYLVIHSVGRYHLRLPNLRIIRGQQYITVRDRKVSLLVSNNYLKMNPKDKTTEPTTTDCVNTMCHVTETYSFLESLEIPNLTSILRHGVYFYDNPGLCYAPFTLKWDDLLETAERQTVDLYALPFGVNLSPWYETCQCRIFGVCTRQNEHTHSIQNDSVLVLEKSETPSDALLTTSMPVEANTQGITSSNPPLNAGKNEDKRSLPRMERSVVEADDTKASVQPIEQTPANPNFQALTGTTPTQPDVLNSTEIRQTTAKEVVVISTVTSSLSRTTTDFDFDTTTEGPQKSQITDQKYMTVAETIWKISTVQSEVPLSEISERSPSSIKPPNIHTTLSTESTKVTSKSAYSTQYSKVPTTEITTQTQSTMSFDHQSDNTNSWMSVTSGMQMWITSPTPLPCHTSCPQIQGRRYCWGPNPSQCQTSVTDRLFDRFKFSCLEFFVTVHKCQFRLCDGSNWCYQIPRTTQLSSTESDYTEHCCHSECASGCHGPRARDCQACLRYSVDGVCTSACPASTIYDKATFTWRHNPHGLLSFGWACVRKCPKAVSYFIEKLLYVIFYFIHTESFLQDGDICVPKCTRPGTYDNKSGKCVPCPNGICPKVCTFKDIEKIKGIDYLHRSSLRAMRNCTTFEGDIKLSRQSFVGDPFYNLTEATEGVQWEDLMEGLSHLQKVTGVVYISAGSDAPWLKNFTFLRELKEIGGASPNVQQTRAININSNQYLEFIGFTSLKRIGHPSILITGNPNLCYLDRIDWESLIDQPTIRLMRSVPKPLELPESVPEDHKALLRAWFTRRDGNNSYRRQSQTTIPAMYISGNGHPEFCRGKAAYCAEECVPEFGCWGPGPSFCRACRFWSIRTSEGTQMCIRNCHLEEGYFTPNRTQEFSEYSTEAVPTATFRSSHTDTADQYANFSVNQKKISSTVNHKEAQVCKPCSPMCRSVINACTGPGPDQCNGPCRWVKDGPYCRKSCPLTKYLNHTTQTCQECSTACSHPLVPALATSLALTNELNSELISHDTHVERTVCTGPGNWPGPGGCNYCRQTVLHPDQQDRTDGSHKIIQCDQTDAALLTRLSAVVQTELMTWLANHTQPLLYGLARICVPCHEECAIESGDHMSNEVPVCTGPGPEQCLRCNNASHEGRCVSHCPDGTYPNATHPFSGSGRLSESSRGPKSLFVCRSCHPFCRLGCFGPSSAECLRCRRVKVYLNRQLTTWKCASICPSIYKFRVRDHRTGDLVCSASAYQVLIISGGDVKEDSSHDIHESVQPDQPNMTNSDDLFLWDHQLLTFEQGVFLSAETVGTIAALSGLVILLIAIGLLIAWAVIKQIPPDEDQEWSSITAKQGWAQMSRTGRLNILCERLWTRGKPRRRLVARPKQLNTQVDIKKFVSGGQSLSTGRNLCYSLEVGQLSAVSEIPTHLNEKRHLLLLDDESHQKSVTDKPNMATLRIITESQLIRGPLIGSGAFGTVFCGIWRPQITSYMDTLSVNSPGSIQTPSTTYSMDWADRLDFLSDKPMLASCSEVAVSSDSGIERQQDNVRLHESVKPISVEIPVAIKVLSDSADPQTNKELLEEAKQSVQLFAQTTLKNEPDDSDFAFQLNIIHSANPTLDDNLVPFETSWEADPNRRPTFQELCLMLGRMRMTPERYLFITSGIRQRQRHHTRIRSSDALEFLTNTLQSSSGCSSGNSVGQMTHSDAQTTVSDSTEYAKIQTDWMRTLCENSQVAPFPPCVQNLLSNYAHLRKAESLSGSQRQLSLTQSVIEDIESAPQWATPSEVMSLLEPPNLMPLLTSFGKPRVSSVHSRATLEEKSNLQELDFEHAISIPVPQLNRQRAAENPVYLTEMTAQLGTDGQAVRVPVFSLNLLNEVMFQ
ncbi:epidermal growth factor receptor [Paragonimus westermani]|uniref:receptor protein-tyrosine kinase n=1 Tax=Paragonimus westermani TaxID=34504 RepID=A0A5J4NUU8_9TREM|nr:epidermal growth factor receptor [Paragonimus westermani]